MDVTQPTAYVERQARESVLLVDDDRDLADMYRLGLESAGFAVRQAENGIDAVSQTFSETPDLILMDQGLPLMSGVEALGRLRSDRRGRLVPVVMFSNSADDELIRRALALGALEWVVKSAVSPTQLAQRVGAWLDGVDSSLSRA
jgi:DNA-binding response OmpR family regulator